MTVDNPILPIPVPENSILPGDILTPVF